MQVLDKFIMMHIPVTDVERAKAFYVDVLGLKAVGHSGPGDQRWVPLELPGGAVFVLTNVHEHMKPGKLKLYFETSDIAAAHRQTSGKGFKVSEVKDDLYGPGSGVKWFNLEDPDGSLVHLVQANQ